jgi:adenylate kinase
MDRGELVPDDVTTRVVEERLSQEDCVGGFILDGFPRTITQAEALEAFLGGKGRSIEGVVSLLVDEEEVIQRMLHRGRDDDNEETIRNRLKVYHRETKPLVQYFRERGRLIEVDGMGPVEEITQRIRDAVAREKEKNLSGERAGQTEAQMKSFE